MYVLYWIILYYIVLYTNYTHIYTHDDPCHDAKARFMDFPCHPIQPLKTQEVTALQNLLTWEDVEGRTIIKGHLQILILLCAAKGRVLVCWNCWILLTGWVSPFKWHKHMFHTCFFSQNERTLGWNMGMLTTKNREDRTKNRNVTDISGTLLSPVACRSFSTNVERPVFEDSNGEMEPPSTWTMWVIRLVDQKWIKSCDFLKHDFNSQCVSTIPTALLHFISVS